MINWSKKIGNAYVKMYLVEDTRDISDDVIREVLNLLTPEELASLDNPTRESIKKIYRRLATQFHPDSSKREMGAVEKRALRLFGKEGIGGGDTATLDRINAVRRARSTQGTQSGGQSTQRTQSGGQSTQRTQSGGQSTQRTQSGGQSTQRTQSGGQSTQRTQSGGGGGPRSGGGGGGPTPPAPTVRQQVAEFGKGTAGYIGGGMAYNEFVPEPAQQALADVGVNVPETSVTAPTNFNANELAMLGTGETAYQVLKNWGKLLNPGVALNALKTGIRSVPGGYIGSQVAGAAFDKVMGMVGGPEKNQGIRTRLGNIGGEGQGVDIPIIRDLSIDTIPELYGYVKGSQLATQGLDAIKTAGKIRIRKRSILYGAC
jgi:hypothetical protein